MKRIKLLGLALLALFALSAVASSVAAAELPEITKPKPSEAEPLKFTSKTKAGSVTALETVSGKRITCEKAENGGEFKTSNHGKGTIAFTGCLEVATKAKCNSNGVAGEITLEGLIELVGLKPASTLELGLWLEPFATGGEAKGEDLKFKCGVLSVTILGSLIGLVDGVTSGTATETALVLWHQTKGVQLIQTCEVAKALCSKGPFDLKAKFTAEGAEELSGQEAEAEVKFAVLTAVTF